jgi:hypothetical protein
MDSNGDCVFAAPIGIELGFSVQIPSTGSAELRPERGRAGSTVNSWVCPNDRRGDAEGT